MLRMLNFDNFLVEEGDLLLALCSFFTFLNLHSDELICKNYHICTYDYKQSKSTAGAQLARVPRMPWHPSIWKHAFLHLFI